MRAHAARVETDSAVMPAAPAGNRDAQAWAGWFRQELMPWWVRHAADPASGGFVDGLSPDNGAGTLVLAPKTCLAQARTLFTLSHLALGEACGEHRALFEQGARAAYRFLRDHMRDPATGGYVRAVTHDGRPTGAPADRVSRSYDQSFMVLALATFGRLAPSAEITAALDACWSFIETRLVDRATGLLIEDDSVCDAGAPDAPLRAQNPHMHMFEAALQAFEMTGDANWLARADALMVLALEHFFDATTGSIMEFRAPDLSPEPGRAGRAREIGHQCEWAWLLHRYARLGGATPVRETADRLMSFAQRFGFCPYGPMRGAAYDVVTPEGGVMAETFLLWPQTEAAKAHVAGFERTGDPEQARLARQIAVLVFERYFAGRPVWCNQLDAEAQVLQPEALTRLLYHVALFVTEGERLGLWPVEQGA
ncbi:AGE family epimerase/isomerase [Ancylobacter pratisalsi]|nr:AGE family epimerase/isomerase [Ancylobacter pratisalsi]